MKALREFSTLMISKGISLSFYAREHAVKPSMIIKDLPI